MTDYALYLDDSGHPNDQPYVVVAGYIASKAQWLEFDAQWRTALAKFGLSEPFHMTDFRQEQHTAFRRDLILSNLASITRRNTLLPLVWAVDVAAYKRVNDEYALEECHGAPFAFAARGLAKELNQWKINNLKDGDHLISFVEQGTKHFGQMQDVFRRDNIPSPVPVPKEMIQVQPCDLLAWETFNYLRSRKESKNLKRLVKGANAESGGIFFESDIRRLCTDTDVIPRSSLRPGDTIRFHSDSKKKVRRRTIF